MARPGHDAIWGSSLYYKYGTDLEAQPLLFSFHFPPGLKIRLHPLCKLYRGLYAHLLNYVFPQNLAEKCRLGQQFHPVYETLRLFGVVAGIVAAIVAVERLDFAVAPAAAGSVAVVSELVVELAAEVAAEVAAAVA